MGHLTKYEKVVFSQSIHNQQTKYQGFSAEADESWHELYKGKRGVSSLLPLS